MNRPQQMSAESEEILHRAVEALSTRAWRGHVHARTQFRYRDRSCTAQTGV